uniref:Bifunctional purine biosynthesis protein ATIC n=1 Tax=Parascaris univalens TaxID=6257 RepID=A0A915BRX7_PARUN
IRMIDAIRDFTFIFTRRILFSIHYTYSFDSKLQINCSQSDFWQFIFHLKIGTSELILEMELLS